MLRLLAFLVLNFTLMSASIAGPTAAEREAGMSARVAISRVQDAYAVYVNKSGKEQAEALNATIQQLESHRFLEIVDLLLAILKEQNASQYPNSYVINASLDTFSKVAGKGSAGVLNQLSVDFVNAHNDKSWHSAVLKNYRAAEQAISGKKDPPSLPKSQFVRDQLQESSLSSTIKMFLMGTRDFLTDTVIKRVENNQWVPVFGREEETDKALDVLIRMKGRVPLFLGVSGVGKTAVMEQIAYLTYMKKLPVGLYQKEISESIFVTTTSAQLSLLAKANDANSMRAAVEIYMEGLQDAEKALGRSIVLCIDEAHTLSSAQMEGFKPFIESQENPVRIMMAMTGKKFGFSFGEDAEILRRIEVINMPEFSSSVAFDLIKKSWLKVYESRYSVSINDDVLKTIIAVAPEIRPDIYRIAGPLKVLEDYCIMEHRLNKGAPAVGSKKNVFKMTARALGIPVVPQDRDSFVPYMDELKSKVKAKVRGQDHMVDALVDQFSTSLTSNSKKHSVIMIAGTTGTGKSYASEVLAEEYYGNKNRYLEIDMTEFVGEYSTNGLFGTARGTVGFNTGKGKICEFFDGPGKGGGIIVLNEIEKADSKVLKKFMELFQTGNIPCTDGVARSLGRSMIIMTTNKGAKKIMPPDFVKNANCSQLEAKARAVTAAEIKNEFATKESYAQKEEVTPVEVLERVDEFLFTTPLCRDVAMQIAKDNIEYYLKDLKAGGDETEITVDPAFAELLTLSMYDPNLGARQIKRSVAKYIGNAIRKHFIEHKSSKKLNLMIARKDNLTPSAEIIVTDEKEQKTKVDGPQVKIDNKLFDQQFRIRLKNLPENLAKHVKGQPELIQAVSRAVKGRASNVDGKSPASIFVVGATGTGKTEIAKALSLELYGIPLDSKKCIIPMGKVIDSYGLNDVFTPPKGFVGSEDEGRFESCIKSIAESGGVVVFDEMSNAGGDDCAKKTAIAKHFYDLLDEGTWCNPSGKCYDLKNITMLFTGNDGDEMFKGISSDDLLESQWKQHGSTSEKVRKILTDKCFPEPFLGRVTEVVMTRPLTQDIKLQVAEKVKNVWVKEAYGKQPFDILFAKNFDEQVAKLTFKSKEGGRSVRTFLTNTVGEIVTDALFEFDYEVLKTKRGQIKIWIEDLSPTKPFYEIKPFESKAIVKIEALMDGKVIYQGSADFTKDAQFMKQITKTDAWGTAFHEAGHALLNDPRKTCQTLEVVTIVPKDFYNGYARYEPIPGCKSKMTQKEVDYEVTQLIAGTVAEKVIGRDPSSGRGNDFEQIRKILERAAFEFSIVPGLESVRRNDKKEPIMTKEQQQVFDQYSQETLKRAEELAEKTIKENWGVMVMAANHLMTKHSMTGKEFEAFSDEVKKLSPEKQKRLERRTVENVKEVLSKYSERCGNLLLERVKNR